MDCPPQPLLAPAGAHPPGWPVDLEAALAPVVGPASAPEVGPVSGDEALASALSTGLGESAATTAEWQHQHHHHCCRAESWPIVAVAAPDLFWDEMKPDPQLSEAGVGSGMSLLCGRVHCPSASSGVVAPPCIVHGPPLPLPLGQGVGAQAIAGRVATADTSAASDDESLVAVGRHCRPRTSSRPRGDELLYQRVVSSKTTLRLLHIPVDMHRHLGLADMYPKQTAGRRGNACVVRLVTPDTVMGVHMMRTSSKGQHHRRFAHGWRDFCRVVGLEVGDTLTFGRRLDSNNELAVQVTKARQPESGGLLR